MGGYPWRGFAAALGLYGRRGGHATGTQWRELKKLWAA